MCFLGILANLLILLQYPPGWAVQHTVGQVHNTLGRQLADGSGSKSSSKSGYTTLAASHQWGSPGLEFPWFYNSTVQAQLLKKCNFRNLKSDAQIETMYPQIKLCIKLCLKGGTMHCFGQSPRMSSFTLRRMFAYGRYWSLVNAMTDY